MSPGNAELIVKILGIIISIGGLASGVYQWVPMRRRTKLKADLEILKLVKDCGGNLPYRNRLEWDIADRMRRTYLGDNRTDTDRSKIAWAVMLAGLGLAIFGFKNEILSILGIEQNPVVLGRLFGRLPRHKIALPQEDFSATAYILGGCLIIVAVWLLLQGWRRKDFIRKPRRKMKTIFQRAANAD